MTISQKGIDLICSFEGFRSHPYLDKAGMPTIGYGTTVYPDGKRVKMSDAAIDKATATAYLLHHVTTRIEPHIQHFTFNQNQYDAICSFCYNEGAGAVGPHTGIGHLLATDPNSPEIKEELAKWKFAAHKELSDLVERRRKEAEYYFS